MEGQWTENGESRYCYSLTSDSAIGLTHDVTDIRICRTCTSDWPHCSRCAVGWYKEGECINCEQLSSRGQEYKNIYTEEYKNNDGNDLVVSYSSWLWDIYSHPAPGISLHIPVPALCWSLEDPFSKYDAFISCQKRTLNKEKLIQALLVCWELKQAWKSC